MDTSELRFSFYSISGNGSDIQRFKIFDSLVVITQVEISFQFFPQFIFEYNILEKLKCLHVILDLLINIKNWYYHFSDIFHFQILLIS